MHTIEAYRDDADEHYLREFREAAARTISARVPVRYRDAWPTVDEVRDWACTLVAHAAGTGRGVCNIDSGRSLMLLGPIGTGKTYEAYGTVRLLAGSGASLGWRFITAADLYGQLRPRHGIDAESVFEVFAKTRFLVVDDLGAAKGSEWTEEINYRLVNHRYEHNRPTLITSNVPPRELSAALGERVASRLYEMADRVALKGADRRRASPPAA